MSDISILPLGGVRENGKNMYVVEVDNDIFVLDAGLKYPENELLGIDVVIPDTTYLVENSDRVAGVFLTHGHADAIGALPYLLSGMDVPVFGSELTIELAKLKVNDYPETQSFSDFHIVDEHTEIDFGETVISFFKTTHTISESLGIQIKTSEGSIVYTGDFKFDQSAVEMYRTDFARLAQIGSDGVLALLSDSSNAENPLQVASEREISEEVLETIRYWEGRIIVASVASNLSRIQQVLDAAFATNRKVFITGQDMERIIRTAMRLGKITLPDEEILIGQDQIKELPDEQILVLETGRMGEPIKGLEHMANGYHKQVKIKEGDLVYIVTTPSIIMETAVAKSEDMIYRVGGVVKLINENLHVSGHANPNDLKLMLNLMKPKFLIPIQGEYRQLAAHQKIAIEVGMQEDDVYITQKGDLLTLDKGDGRFHVSNTVPAENVMIDGIGIGDIGNIVLKDRRILSEDGILVIVTTISRRENKIISKPKVTSRGFVFQKTSRDILKESGNIAEEVILRHLGEPQFEWGRLKGDVREQLSRYLFEQTKRRPVILPVIMEGSSRHH